MLAPFFFVVFNVTSNNTGGRGGLNCSVVPCRLSNCWAEEHTGALLVRVPSGVMMPLHVNQTHFPVIQYRAKRDFGFTAFVTAIIAAVAASATAAGFALAQSIQSAEVINQLSERVATALQTQADINAHLHFGILSLNQQMALVQKQIDNFYILQRLTCDVHYHAACVIPVQVCNASAKVWELNQYLAGPWNATFVNYTRQLALQIAQINATRVTPVTAQSLWTAITRWSGWVQRWAGSMSLLGIVALSAAFCLWCLCRLRRHRRRDVAMLAQAITAVDAGTSPQVWLAAVHS